MDMPNDKQQFRLGRVVATPGALAAFQKTNQSPIAFLDRHCTGDFGDLTIDDRNANAAAVKDGGRIMSTYKLFSGIKIWVITEAVGDDGERASTCILLPDEY